LVGNYTIKVILCESVNGVAVCQSNSREVTLIFDTKENIEELKRKQAEEEAKIL